MYDEYFYLYEFFLYYIIYNSVFIVYCYSQTGWGGVGWGEYNISNFKFLFVFLDFWWRTDSKNKWEDKQEILLIISGGCCNESTWDCFCISRKLYEKRFTDAYTVWLFLFTRIFSLRANKNNCVLHTEYYATHTVYIYT